MNESNFNANDIEKLEKSYINLIPEKASFLFVTYNRAPNKDFERNPITWAFQSLLAGSKYIEEFLVVIDGSNDFTLENLMWLKSKYNLPLRVIQHSKRRGCSLRRQEGIRELKGEYFFMGDDDCLYSKDFIFGSLFYYQYLKLNYNVNPAIIVQPIFELDIDFSGSINKKYIGKNDFSNAWFYHNFDKLPDNLSEKMVDGVKIYNSIKIETFKGVSLNRRSAIIKSGNFLDLSMWSNDYSEHIELSTRMTKKNETMFYIPDKRLSTTHLRFGSKGAVLTEKISNYTFPNLKLTLGEMRSISDEFSLMNTGCRVSGEEFKFVKIGSFVSFFLKVDEDSAWLFVKREYKNFVESNINTIFDQELSHLNFDERLTLWSSAIKYGIEIFEKQTSTDTSTFKRKMNEEYKTKYF